MHFRLSAPRLINIQLYHLLCRQHVSIKTFLHVRLRCKLSAFIRIKCIKQITHFHQSDLIYSNVIYSYAVFYFVTLSSFSHSNLTTQSIVSVLSVYCQKQCFVLNSCPFNILYTIHPETFDIFSCKVISSFNS